MILFDKLYTVNTSTNATMTLDLAESSSVGEMEVRAITLDREDDKGPAVVAGSSVRVRVITA